jgi:hypothetical protein
MDPLDRMIRRLAELIEERDTLTERVDEIQNEIGRIQGAIDVVGEFDPFGNSVDSRTPSRFASVDLKSPTLAVACAAILRETGEPATARDLVNVLMKAGRWGSEKPSHLISVIQTLKKRTDLFVRDGKAWRLTNKLLPDAPASTGHGFEPLPMESE